MKVSSKLAALGFTVATVAVATVAPAHAECKTLGAVGTGVTNDIAKYMADAALKNIRENAGYKASSQTSYKCGPAALPIAIDCHAAQKVCK